MIGDLQRRSGTNSGLSILDGECWQAGDCWRAFGVSFAIRVNNETLLKRLEDHFPPGSVRNSAPRIGRLYSFLSKADDSGRDGLLIQVYANSNLLAETPNHESAVHAFESDLQLYVAEMAQRRVFVHAGVVEWQNEAILLPGRSFSGKTTLVAALVQAGAAYFSDEFAVLDKSGRVYPYPCLLSMRHDTGRTRCAPDSLGGRIATQPLPVGLVFFCQYRPASVWSPSRLSAGQGALGLLRNTVSARRKPTAALEALQSVVRRAAVFDSPRGEAKTIAANILSNFEQYRDKTAREGM